MSLFKFGTIGMISKAINNPRVRAIGDVKPGYVFGVTDNYSSGGTKSKVDIVVGAGTIADGVVSFNVGGHNIYTTIVALTQDTAAKVAALIKSNADAVLLGLGYTVAIDTATITIEAPAVGTSSATVVVDNKVLNSTTVTLTATVTAGTDAIAYAEAAVAFASDAAAKAAPLWVCMNIIDTPEQWNQADYKITAGGDVNANQLNNLIGYTVEMSSDLCATAFGSVSVGDFLVPAGSAGVMTWKKVASSTTGYPVCLKVVEKTLFGGTGYLCKIIEC